MKPAIFPRSFHKSYPQAARGEGCYIFTADGRKYLDACGGAAVVSIGHGVSEVAQAMSEQAMRLAYAHTSQFHTDVAEALAQRLRAMAPANFREAGRVFFTSGGSEATETSLKLCRQYWLERGEPQRTRVVSRLQSYHGATVGALSVSGNVRRRRTFAPLLHDWGQIAPCYCYRCPLQLSYPGCEVACANELEGLLQRLGPETVAAFIVEPISGATLGAAVPPDGYLERIAEIARRHNILLIADEIMTGMGRTEKMFAVEHWGVAPDMMLVGKGVASGYAPLGAVLASGEITEAIAQGSGGFPHGFTYSAHPVAAAAGLAVLDYATRHHLFEQVLPRGRELRQALEPLKRHSLVGDIRGRGLLLGVEFVRDSATKDPFPPAVNLAGRIFDAAMAEGVLTYPMQGCVDGEQGDHILLAPPYTISSEEIQFLTRALDAAIDRVAREFRATREAK